MNTILLLDQQFFFFLNHLPHNTFFDGLTLTLSGIGTAGLVWFALAIVLFLREERRNHRFFIPMVTAGAVCGFIVNIILKPLIARPRPTVEMGAIIFVNHIGNSFPSGHATIAFAMAVVLSAAEPKWRGWFFGLALAISFSRIYLGVHYPLDVIAGAVFGWIIGRLSLRFLAIIKK